MIAHTHTKKQKQKKYEAVKNSEEGLKGMIQSDFHKKLLSENSKVQ